MREYIGSKHDFQTAMHFRKRLILFLFANSLCVNLFCVIVHVNKEKKYMDLCIYLLNYGVHLFYD